MANTRFMERMFSATDNQEEEVLNQVAGDINEAKANGEVDTDELKYEKIDDNRVLITDKANNEITIAEEGEEGNIDLYNPEDQLEEESSKMDGYLHPEVKDEVIPGNQTNPTEDIKDHVEDGTVAPNYANNTCPECGNKSCECEAPEEDEDEQKEFSVYSDNTVIQKIFSQQEYCEMLFSEVITSEEVEDVAKVGNLKIEKVDDDTVIVSDLESGDQAKVKLEEDEMEVEELSSKEFTDDEEEEYADNDEQYDPIHVVGIDAINHVLVDSPVYTEDEAEELAERLSEAGVDGVQVIEDESDARDYAIDLLNNLGVESEEDVEEPEEVTFSDTRGNEWNIFVTRYYSNNTVFMDRLFSETEREIEVSQAKIEDALENGDEIETEAEIVTPISATEAVVEDKDNGEFTKVTVEDDNMSLDAITEDEANELLEDIAVSEDEVDEDEEEIDDDEEEAAEEEAEEELEDDDDDEEDEKDFSDIYTNESETKFFSENEPMTNYMIRLFSEEEKEEMIEKAIEDGDQIETDTVVITPVDSETAVIEDKDNGEFTKAVLSDEDIDVTPITEEEADELTEDLAVSEEAEEVEEEDDDKDKEEDGDKDKEKEDEKKFSGNVLDKWFADVVAPNAPAQQAPAQAAPAQAAQPNQAAPVEENTEVVEEAPTVSVEAIEDKAVAAVQQIQAAAAEAEAQILNAKSAPVEGENEDLQEATFSQSDEEEKTFSENDTLMSWLNNTRL